MGMKLTETDPLVLLATDREEARSLNDPMVDRCILGTIDRNSKPALRTLVLREIEGQLAVFYSQSSSKHGELLNSRNRASLLIFLPSIGVQYRVDAKLTKVPRDIVEQHWQLKPNAAKRMDAIYERLPQSAVVDDFAAFMTIYLGTVPPRKAPLNGTGCYVEATSIERLRLRTDPEFHERALFRLGKRGWEGKWLVP